jgi:hypothetical protein
MALATVVVTERAAVVAATMRSRGEYARGSFRRQPSGACASPRVCYRLRVATGKRALAIIQLVLVAGCLARAPGPVPTAGLVAVERAQLHMGTVVTVTGRGADAGGRGAVDRRGDSPRSNVWTASSAPGSRRSEVTRLNAAAGRGPFTIGADTLAVLVRAHLDRDPHRRRVRRRHRAGRARMGLRRDGSRPGTPPSSRPSRRWSMRTRCASTSTR